MAERVLVSYDDRAGIAWARLVLHGIGTGFVLVILVLKYCYTGIVHRGAGHIMHRSAMAEHQQKMCWYSWATQVAWASLSNLGNPGCTRGAGCLGKLGTCGNQDNPHVSPRAQGGHVVVLRSDGRAVAVGDDEHGQCAIPELPWGVTYTAIDAGATHTVLLRSDGQAVACGDNRDGQCDIPPLGGRSTYTQARYVEHGVATPRGQTRLASGRCVGQSALQNKLREFCGLAYRIF